MTNEELKKKIEDILEEYNFETDDGEGWVLSTDAYIERLKAENSALKVDMFNGSQKAVGSII